MLAPSLFNDSFDLFDRFYQDPWFGFNDHEFKNLEKKLYGHRAKNIMNTDIKESDSEYEMVIDLPGFKKDQMQMIQFLLAKSPFQIHQMQPVHRHHLVNHKTLFR